MTTKLPQDLIPKKAVREKEKISISFVGSASSGKTASALILAKGIVQEAHPELDPNSDEFWSKIWLADTEHNRSKAYANTNIPNTNFEIGSFMHIDFNPPFSVDRVSAIMDYAAENGCEVFILDSFSSTWSGVGGELDVQQDLGGQFAHWRKLNPVEDKLYSYVFRNKKIHVISCVRAKATYSMVQSPTGKSDIVKLGIQPVARDNFEYEPWVTLHLGMNHVFTATNDKTGLFLNEDTINEEYGKQLYLWAEQGITVKNTGKEELLQKLKDYSEKNSNEFKDIAQKFLQKMRDTYGTTTLKELPISELNRFVELIEKAIEPNVVVMGNDIAEESTIVETTSEGISFTERPTDVSQNKKFF